VTDALSVTAGAPQRQAALVKKVCGPMVPLLLRQHAGAAENERVIRGNLLRHRVAVDP
jgi:hypothetical protein